MTSELAQFLKSPKTVSIVGCPFSGGQPKIGVDEGPIHLVEAGLVNQLQELGWNVKFDGHHQFEDIKYTLSSSSATASSPAAGTDNDTSTTSNHWDPPIGILKNPRLVSRVCEEVAKVVSGHAKKGELPLTLGGDHSLAMGTISGTLDAHPSAGVIWVDAHADINTAATTESGNIHGMPVSFLMGLDGNHQAFSDYNKSNSPSLETPFAWIKPVLKPSSIVYIGLRDVDSGEKKILKDNGIKAFSMHDVDRYGIGKVVEMALDYLNADNTNPDEVRPIHLSFDVDALDPSVAPSTGTPVRGGLTFREGHYICERIWETGALVGLDLMEVNPSLEDDVSVKQTVAVGCSLVRAALGETLL
ncbi:Ureohydrolase [Lentinula edodes]|uniref:putative arginase n=1 Tax=Lentinula edodes TaxID=5353 RepID=UPI001E8E2886|nr:putative arginase [Lentinula edodes]KAH7867740.1 putative arginase [Lentinula edodes]KAJ3899935.1 Ureohydrolase [Lentinula edodes]